MSDDESKVPFEEQDEDASDETAAAVGETPTPAPFEVTDTEPDSEELTASTFGEPGPTFEDVAALEARVEELELENEGLKGTIAALEARLAGTIEDVAEITSIPPRGFGAYVPAGTPEYEKLKAKGGAARDQAFIPAKAKADAPAETPTEEFSAACEHCDKVYHADTQAKADVKLKIHTTTKHK